MKLLLLTKIAFLSIFGIILCNNASAQYSKPSKADSTTNVRAQTVYAEIGGAGLFFSLNYDTRFSQRQDGIGGRVGVGLISSGGYAFYSIPVQLNYLLGKNGKYFEVGAGASYVDFKGGSDFLNFDGEHASASTIIGTLTFGYRYQPVEGGFSFRASFNPIFNSTNFFPYAGISLGYAFK